MLFLLQLYLFPHYYAIILLTRRSFRNNPTLAALNQFYIEELSKLAVKKGLQFTVVDAFGIIYPRLVFPEKSEVDCWNHFLCRRFGKVNKLEKKDIEGKETEAQSDQMWHNIYTPGGAAVLHSIQIALEYGLRTH